MYHIDCFLVQRNESCDKKEEHGRKLNSELKVLWAKCLGQVLTFTQVQTVCMQIHDDTENFWVKLVKS